MSTYRANCSDCFKPIRTRALRLNVLCGTCEDKRKKAIAQKMDDNIALWGKVANPDLSTLHSVIDGNVRFCKIHGIVHHDGFARLSDCSCPCAKTSAPSKTIRSTTIHFAVKSKSKGWFVGCTLAPSGSGIEQMRADGDKVNITNHLSHVSCRQCAIRLRRVLAKGNE